MTAKRRKLSVGFATVMAIVIALWVSAFYLVLRDYFFGGTFETLLMTSIILLIFIFGGYLSPNVMFGTE